MGFRQSLKLIPLLSLLAVGCARGPASVSSTPPSNQKPSIDLTNPTFTQVYKLVIGPKCVECHSEAGGNKGDLNLETYKKVRAMRGLIKESVSGGWMPPASRPELTTAEKELVLRWIEQGAKDN